MTEIYRTWETRLEGETLTRGQIGQWCKAIVPLALGMDPGGARTNMTETEAAALVSQFREYAQNRYGYKLTPEHDRFGREWIAGNWKRLWDEYPRPDDLVSPDQMLPTETFRFVSWELHGQNPYNSRVSVYPVYRTLYLDDYGEIQAFEYSWSPWQQQAYR